MGNSSQWCLSVSATKGKARCFADLCTVLPVWVLALPFPSYIYLPCLVSAVCPVPEDGASARCWELLWWLPKGDRWLVADSKVDGFSWMSSSLLSEPIFGNVPSWFLASFANFAGIGNNQGAWLTLVEEPPQLAWTRTSDVGMDMYVFLQII